MYGLQYELKCPYCGKDFVVHHGITSYYKINGYGDSEYVLEHCWKCNKSYYRRCYDTDAMKMKNDGLTYEEALIKLEERDKEFNIFCFGKNGIVPEQRLKEQEERRIEICNEVYFTEDNKLHIDSDTINKEDLIYSSGVCW